MKLVSTAFTKAILGITDTGSDRLLEIWGNVATDTLQRLLGVTSLASHAVTDERVTVSNQYRLALSEYPIDLTAPITVETTLRETVNGVYFSQSPGDRRTLQIEYSDGKPQPLHYNELLVSYTAGYRLQDAVTVAGIAGLAEKTVTVDVDGILTVWTFKASGATGNQINVGADAAATAANIATALGGSVSGTTVTLPLGTGMTLGTATALQLAIVSANLPHDLKIAAALIAGGGLTEKNKKGGIVSYSIGSKSVTFRNDAEANAAAEIVKTYAAYFRKATIISA